VGRIKVAEGSAIGLSRGSNVPP